MESKAKKFRNDQEEVNAWVEKKNASDHMVETVEEMVDLVFFEETPRFMRMWPDWIVRLITGIDIRVSVREGMDTDIIEEARLIVWKRNKVIADSVYRYQSYMPEEVVKPRKKTKKVVK